MNIEVPSPLEQLDDARLKDHGVRMFLKRDDLISTDVPGNKWRKLKYNLIKAREEEHKTLLTFGGAYSNHIRATAAAGSAFGFSTIGVIRGEASVPLNPSLEYAVRQGMRLTYVDRASYRNKTEATFIQRLHRQFGDFYLLPEGGSNVLALRGCRELVGELDINFDIIACACGTGATLAGISSALNSRQRALGFSALKGGFFLNQEVANYQSASKTSIENWSIETDYHFGGFARRNIELDRFVADFYERHGITLEWVYVAKMLYGIFDLVNQRKFPEGTTIIAVITG